MGSVLSRSPRSRTVAVPVGLPIFHQPPPAPFGRVPYTTTAVTLLIVANVVQAAKIFDHFYAGASRAAYAVQAIVILVYAVIAIVRGRWAIVAVALFGLACMIGAHLVFVHHARVPPNFNVVFMYVPMLSFVVFAEMDLPVRRALQILIVVVTAYLVVYVLAGPALLASGDASVLLAGHDGDAGGARVYLAAAYASFVAFYAVRANHLALVTRGALLAVALLAIGLSGTRSFFALMLFVGGMAWIGLVNLPVRLAMLVVALGGMAFILGGVVVEGWNPFALAGTDSSVVYRANEYTYAVRAIRHTWYIGVGTPPDFGALQLWLRTPRYEPLYPSDLGIIAPLFEFGVAGIVAFLAAVVFVVSCSMLSRDAGIQALQLNCLLCAIDGAVTPLLLFEPAVLFLAMFVAAWLRRRGARWASRGLWFNPRQDATLARRRRRAR